MTEYEWAVIVHALRVATGETKNPLNEGAYQVALKLVERIQKKEGVS